MLKTLLKKHMFELNSSFFYDSKKGKLRSKASSIIFIAAYVLLMVGVLGGLFAYLSFSICAPLSSAGLGWLYFCIMALLAVALGVFGSVFNTFSSLYKAKDNDLLLSLPIPVRSILVVRLAGVYLMGLMFSAVIMLPAVIVYWIVVRPGFGGIVGGLVLTLVISVFVLVLSCLLGWVVAKVSTKLKNKSLVTVILSLAFFAGYYYFYFNASQLLQTLLLNAGVFGDSIMHSAYPLYLLGSCGVGDALSMLIVTAAVAAMFALVWVVLSRSFLKLATASDASAKVKYREKASKVRSPRSALLSKEFSRFLNSPSYMLNCALGSLFLVITAALIVIKGDWLMNMLTNEFGLGADMACVVLVLGVCVVAAMNDITAPSISLEGKSLWLVQSLPVQPRQVLLAKLRLHMLLTAVPALICSICICIVLRPGFAPLVLTLLLPLLFALFVALLGLVINVENPNLGWTNETAAVKQSMGVLIVLLSGWVLAAALALGCYFTYAILTSAEFLACCAALLLIICALLYRLLMTRGVRLLQHM